MDARPRGTLLSSSAGFLFASFGFTLSVLTTLFYLLWPFSSTRVSPEASLPTIRRVHQHKHKGKSVSPPSLTSTPSTASSSSSSDSSPEQTIRRRPSKQTVARSGSHRARSRSLERAAHNRNASERIGRGRHLRVPEPLDRGVRRRSESTPPTPTPRQWAFSEEQTRAPSPERRSSLHLERTSSMDFTHGHLSFLHLPKKLHRSSSGISSEVDHPLEKRPSQLFAPLLHHKRKSIEHKRSSIVVADEDETASGSSPEAQAEHHRTSSDHGHGLHLPPAPKRSQTLRTRPYEAPYFFPAPGTVQAEEYVPPRPKPKRSGTLPLRKQTSEAL